MGRVPGSTGGDGMTQVMTPFRNGFSTLRADALPRGDGRWRVFLFLQAGPRQVDVEAPSPGDAIRTAWAKLKEERVK